MRLLKYFVKRLIILVICSIALLLMVFAVTQFFPPEQRAVIFLRQAPRRPGDIEGAIIKYRLKEPWYIQFQIWMSEVFSGNLGWSQTANGPVLAAMLAKFPATVEIVMFSIPLTILGGMFLGVKSAEHQGKPVDYGTGALSIVGYSLPVFWLGIILIAIFASALGWFPMSGRLGTSALYFVTSRYSGWRTYSGIYTIDGILNWQFWITLDALRHLVLPTILLTITTIAIILTVTRSSMLGIIRKRYIYVTTRKELTLDEVTSKRMRISALFPASMLSGLFFGSFLMSIIITEVIFNFDGLGRWVARAAISLDVASVVGFTLSVGFFFLIASFIVDIVYAYMDSRIV